jgi:hypothetical protein
VLVGELGREFVGRRVGDLIRADGGIAEEHDLLAGAAPDDGDL